MRNFTDAVIIAFYIVNFVINSFLQFLQIPSTIITCFQLNGQHDDGIIITEGLPIDVANISTFQQYKKHTKFFYKLPQNFEIHCYTHCYSPKKSNFCYKLCYHPLYTKPTKR